jgi:hypothetical protein
MRAHDVKPLRRPAEIVVVGTILALTVASCDGLVSDASPTPRPSTPATDLSAIACATADPTNVGPLTGAWEGNDNGVYYIRQVGDCVWWFGTEVDELAPAGQGGFANVASGRIDGTRIELEYVDIPLGTTMGGGGLTFVYYEELDQLALIEQRGDWLPFGGTRLTRIQPGSSPDASPSESASP